ncbi:DUF4856 domain-containing protein [Aureispira anguillae]|uniref:DUF4856 domain-containing protein n=1 Tax=Aureispira anguillae TaxID=2864201 RepID=A0A916DQT4_9BACT|nr:DUF4856 domain-containing protein [Aureispira anguillae]BDS11364.1 DUF4856 domain-containing protein [Aureispira anguillae]
MKNCLYFLVTLTGFLFYLSSCEKAAPTYIIPTTYNFDNVNYSGQTTRINMLKELADYAKSANTMGAPALSAVAMTNMYTNVNAPFSNADLNNSVKQLKSKTDPIVQNNFESYMTALAAASQHTNRVATAGQAGILSSNDGSKSYLLNSNGMELAQIIEKGLASACLYYQATVIYLGETKMNVDNKAIISGKGTNMEHHWDESFGYYGAPIDFPSNTNNLELWARYSNKVNAILGCNSKIMNAYLKGRAAISAGDYDTRDAMRSSLKTNWEEIHAAVAISYLNDAKTHQADPAIYYHNLTEAYAFIAGLKHGASQTLPDFDINGILSNLAGSSDPLQANLYSTSIQKIDNTINALANTFTNLETVKASL